MRKIREILDGISARLGGERSLENVSRSSDIVLAAALVGILAMLIMPIPPQVIDYLLSINIAASITLLMVALYIPGATHLTIFPSLLLITTLYRLGLNICITRQILLHAYAGQIVMAFGTYVMGGNFVVGAILFIIITLVQFIVITKGAERVAEVAARFTLDAMPGKQMSIDADMRAGTLDANQAREKRLALQKESQLYGAMDGAMKFVKGDAIASIIITTVNIIGGLIIGVAMMSMTAGDSAKTFGLLSIGGGLVAQIPALLIAITAGIVTTRVTTEGKESNLGKEISLQMLRQPKAVMIAAGITMGIGLIPGFPIAPFFLLSSGFGLLGYSLWSTEQREPESGGGGGGSTAGPGGAAATIESAAVDTPVKGHKVISGGGVDSYSLTLPVILEVGKTLSIEIQKTGKTQGFIEQMIPKMRQALYADLGIRFPGVHVRTDSPNLAQDEYLIYLNEVPVVRGKIIESHFLTNETEENLKRYNMPFTSYKNSLGLPSLWVENKHKEILDKAGIKYWNPLEVMVLHLSYFFRHYANEFLGIQEAKSMLEFMEKYTLAAERTTPDLKQILAESLEEKCVETFYKSVTTLKEGGEG